MNNTELDFKLDVFEGPLDLLLVLIEKNKVDIYDIPISTITDQYLQYVESIETEDLDLLSDFLVMATTLLDIKARMLLPKEENEEGVEIDPREELVRRLIEYQEYKMMADELKDLYEESDGVYYHEESIPDEVKHFRPKPDMDRLLKNVTVENLQRVFVSVMTRRDDKLDPVRAHFGDIEKEKVRVSEKLAYVFKFGGKKKKFSFRGLLENAKTKQEIVVTFLACLELIRIGQIIATQSETFGEIDMEWNDECENKLTEEEMKQYD